MGRGQPVRLPSSPYAKSVFRYWPILDGSPASWTTRRIWKAWRSGSGFGYGLAGQGSAAVPAGLPGSFLTLPLQFDARFWRSVFGIVPRLPRMAPVPLAPGMGAKSESTASWPHAYSRRHEPTPLAECGAATSPVIG